MNGEVDGEVDTNKEITEKRDVAQKMTNVGNSWNHREERCRSENDQCR